MSKAVDSKAKTEAVQELLHRLAKDGYIPQHLHLERCQADRRQQSVYVARAGADKVILKIYQGANASERARTAAAALEAVSPGRNAGAYRVPQLLWAAPDHGMIVMSHCAGIGLDKLLQQGPSAELRMNYLQRAGGWLDWYSAGRKINPRFTPGFWLSGLHNALNGHDPLPDDLPPLLSRLEAMARTIANTPVETGPSHGDFTPGNVLISADHVCGIDIQGAFKLPFPRALAVFLVWLTIKSPASDIQGGVGIADRAALCEGAGLGAEFADILTFFIGEQLVWRRIDAGLEAPCPMMLEILIDKFCAA